MLGAPTLIAHRGVHQIYNREDLEKSECTATRIYEPTHDYLENTLRSMHASFKVGADLVEIDIHPTIDGEFMVFHDWTVDCRTDGSGVTREQTSAYLKSLDIGYGYTHDGGETYPFRGKGIGQMPTLGEVLQEFPKQRFLINIKSNDKGEAKLLLEYLDGLNLEDQNLLSVYGGGKPIALLMDSIPDFVFVHRARATRCAMKYLLIGWTSYVPEDCRQHAIVVPINIGWMFWGWPDRFFQRMQAVGSEVVLWGPISPSRGFEGFVDPLNLAKIPQGFNGSIWVETIEQIGPLYRN